MNTSASQKAADTEDPYSLSKIMGLWLAVSAPMGILTWIIYPTLKNRVNMNPGILLWILMITGLMWQVVLSLAILYRETGTLNLGTTASHLAAATPGSKDQTTKKKVMVLADSCYFTGNRSRIYN